MEWSTSATDEAIVGQPRGRVDETGWEAFLAGLVAAVEEAKGKGRLVLDLSGVDYMSSRGLRALTIAKRDGDEKEVTLLLAAPNDRMREILAISRYDKIFRIIDAVDTPL